MRGRTIKVDYLARVEGEGALYLRLSDGKVTEVQLKIFEPPRFFEAFLQGRNYSEVPDITARICGICPVAYQMSSCHAIEQAFGMRVEGPLRELRRLLYCGEWIESHALHVFFLHAPDFLGYQDAIQMAQDFPEIVQKALRLKKVGNDLVAFLAGREIHPINVRVGGFYKIPSKDRLLEQVGALQWARETALEMVQWTSRLSFPDFEQDYEYVALRHPKEYPLNEGRLVSNKGLDIDVREYDNVFEEYQAPYSNALQSVIKGRGSYLVGPLARFNLNFDRLTPLAQEAWRETGLPFPCNNPFMSIVVRSVEILYACDEALRIIEQYEPPDAPYVTPTPKAGFGYGCTEAPRGILYHRYKLNEEGTVLSAKIVPPTAQNQKRIEEDLWHFVPSRLHLSREQLTWECEQAIRNYDPCISCATHFLKLEVEERNSA